MPNYKVHKLFPCPVFQYQIENYKKINEELEKYILDLKKKFPEGQKKSNSGGGWHSPDFMLNKDSPPYNFFQNIKKFINIVIENEMGWAYNSDKVRITNMWSIINKKGSNNIRHMHPNSYLSSAYYVKVPKNSGNISFFDPKEQKNFSYPPIKKNTELSAEMIHIKPEEGNLLLFPAYLYHAVSENSSNEDRIVVSFNITIDR